MKERLRLTNYHLVTAGLVIIIAAFFADAVLLRSALSASGSSKNLCLSQVF